MIPALLVLSLLSHDDWVLQASAGLPPVATEALGQIVGGDRRLLALRAYLRAGDALIERWSWTRERIAAYPSTPEGRAAAADIDAVSAVFAAADPGFTLQVNQQPRSLELQIARWNANQSVGRTAAMLVAALEQRFPGNGEPPGTAELQQALVEWQPESSAALAAPGLSAHGQARAFDFVVTQQGKIIAGLELASAHRDWDAAGWTQKLRAAISAAGNRFVGPLQSPYEPWHYAYTPSR